MKETFYFPHDNNAINDPKMMELLSECGLAGIGLYWVLIEIMHQQDDGKITRKTFDKFIKFYSSFETDVEHMLNTCGNLLISCGLFVEAEGYIFSKRVVENKEFRKDLIEKRSQAGKKSAKIRALNSEQSTHVEQNGTHVEQGKERKGKENEKEKENKTNNNKEKTSFSLIDDFLKSSLGKNLIKSEKEHENGFIDKSGECYLGNEKFIKELLNFIKMRKEIKKPMTTRAVELILLQGRKYEIETFIKMVEASILNSWQGVFELKSGDLKEINKENVDYNAV